MLLLHQHRHSQATNFTTQFGIGRKDRAQVEWFLPTASPLVTPSICWQQSQKNPDLKSQVPPLLKLSSFDCLHLSSLA